MDQQIKVSVLIPAYNVEAYIDQCLESVMNQTLREIEIIVTDDGSTDGTLARIEAAAEKDGRIRIIRHGVNLGIYMTRKDAVLASRGEYIMFVDSDDWLELNACEIACTKAKETGVDILHYGSSIENCANRPQRAIDRTTAFVAPYIGEPLTMPLLTACFVGKKFNFTIWNKLYRAEKVKRAFSLMDDGYFSMGEDVYEAFFLLMDSRTYLGIENILYHYCFGRGMTGHHTLTPELFSCNCQSAKVWLALDRQVGEMLHRAQKEEERELAEAARRALKEIRAQFVKEQIGLWLDNVKKEDQAEGFLIMEKAWKEAGCTNFVGPLAQYGWDKRRKIAEALAGADYLKFEKRPVKTVVFYYYRAARFGTERVTTTLCNLLAEQMNKNGEPRYRVVLVTDEEPSEEDFPISPLVIREKVPPCKESTKENYVFRAEAWARIVEEYQVDALLYSFWDKQMLLWDLLSIKRTLQSPAFVIHVHSWCAAMYKERRDSVEERARTYRLADGVVTLSEADRLYWSRINPNTRYIPNPCFAKASETRHASFGKHILWLGRISHEKQPLEIPRIMREVVARDPEIICHVVGEFDAKLMDKLRESVAAEGLTGNIVLEGFHADVAPFYERCSLFLMTSRFEGFPLVLFEAASYGLPTVLYELPWLSYNELIDGAVIVPQLDAEAAAEAIVRLVNDPEEWQRRSDAIYNSALRYEETDITAYWTSLIESLEKGTLPDEPRFDRQTEILLDQIDAFHDKGVSGLMRDRDCEAQKARNLEGELNSIKGSVSFRLGRALTWAPRKVRGLVRCYREHGAAYTARQFVKHLTGKA